MIKSKAIEIIKKLSEKERDEFKTFLGSLYFNKKKKLIELYNIILKNFNSLDLDDVSEKEMFAKIFSNEKFSYSFIRNLMSDLLNQCEIFLIINNLRNKTYSDIQCNRILLREYNSRFLDNQFKLKIKKIQKEFKNSKIYFEYYDVLGKLEAELIAFNIYRSSMENIPLNVLQRSEYNLCYITQLLEFDITDLTVNMKAYNLNFDKELLFEFVKNIDIENFLQFLKERGSPFQNELEIRLRLIQLSMNQEDEDNYYTLKKLVLKNIGNYSNIEKSNMFTKLKNYCGTRIYNGKINFYDEKYLLAKLEMENVKYNSDGVGPLYSSVYIEIIRKAVLENDIKFAKKYIQNFTRELEKTRMESLHNLAMALIEFSNKKFDKTLSHLIKVDTFNYFIKNICKTLYLKTYYELNLFENGLSLLDSYIHYIKETKDFTDNRKDLLKMNYIILKKLFKIKLSPEKYSQYDLEILKNEIGKSKMYYTEWYIEKIDELQSLLKK